MERDGLRIALTSEGTRGDIEPLLSLAERFRERGHEVFLCASPDFANAAAARQLEFHAIGRSVRELMLEQAEAMSRGGIALLLSVRRFLATTLADQFEQLPKAVRGANLIIGAGVQAAAASTAEIYSLPYRYVIYCPTLLPSAEHPPTFFPLPHSPPWLNRRLWSLARLGFNRGMRPALNRHRSAMGLAPRPFDVAGSARTFWPTRSPRHSITSSSPNAPEPWAGACARAWMRIRPLRSSRMAAPLKAPAAPPGARKGPAAAMGYGVQRSAGEVLQVVHGERRLTVGGVCPSRL